MKADAGGILRFTAEAQESGERLDLVLSRHDGLSRSAVQKAIEAGNVTVNGLVAVKNYKIRTGDCIEYVQSVPQPLDASAENIPLDIVYEDNDIIVINKPQGMVVHPAAGNVNGTLVNALLYHCGDSLSGINGVIRPGIVHRIDKDTSGLLAVAKNDDAHRCLGGAAQAAHYVENLSRDCLGKFQGRYGYHRRSDCPGIRFTEKR